MQILKIKINGLPLFADGFEFDLYAKQKVSNDKNEMLTKLFSNVYTNNVISTIGINASGKTTTLKAISFFIQMLTNKPINSINSNTLLNCVDKNEEVCVETYFYDNSESIYKLQTYIENTSDVNQMNKFVITNETLWKKSIKSVRSKKDLFQYDDGNIVEQRRTDDVYLLDDVSIIIKLNKTSKFELSLIDSIEWTNLNSIRITEDFPMELVKFLDPSIEYLELKSKNNDENLELKLKFINKNEISLGSFKELEKFLSSGTIKGINIFLATMITLKNGGYIIIDELENHFNMEIVATLVRLFTDNSTNNKGATIIFSTHYIELIDSLERNDCIYVTNNLNGIKIDNLASILKRNDVKKSEWFQSGYLEYTTPSYQRYIDFKRKLITHIS